uniref:RING-type domain-containing protein n=1 Tax=Macrostomum lignano TaxID=282301 RepID=A0A1I8ISR4_9PLAT
MTFGLATCEWPIRHVIRGSHRLTWKLDTRVTPCSVELLDIQQVSPSDYGHPVENFSVVTDQVGKPQLLGIPSWSREHSVITATLSAPSKDEHQETMASDQRNDLPSLRSPRGLHYSQQCDVLKTQSEPMGHLLSCHRLRGGDTQRNRRFSIHSNNGNGVAKLMPPLACRRTQDSYAEKAKIDSEELVLRYLHLMNDDKAGRRRDASCRVSFRAESFDSQSSTKSERCQFVIDLVDNLPETFIDDDLPPASIRGRLTSWSSESDNEDFVAEDDAVFFVENRSSEGRMKSEALVTAHEIAALRRALTSPKNENPRTNSPRSGQSRRSQVDAEHSGSAEHCKDGKSQRHRARFMAWARTKAAPPAECPGRRRQPADSRRNAEFALDLAVRLGADEMACELESPAAQQITWTWQASAAIECRVVDSLDADVEGGAQQASVRRIDLLFEEAKRASYTEPASSIPDVDDPVTPTVTCRLLLLGAAPSLASDKQKDGIGERVRQSQAHEGGVQVFDQDEIRLRQAAQDGVNRQTIKVNRRPADHKNCHQTDGQAVDSLGPVDARAASFGSCGGSDGLLMAQQVDLFASVLQRGGQKLVDSAVGHRDHNRWQREQQGQRGQSVAEAGGQLAVLAELQAQQAQAPVPVLYAQRAGQIGFRSVREDGLLSESSAELPPLAFKCRSVPEILNNSRAHSKGRLTLPPLARGAGEAPDQQQADGQGASVSPPVRQTAAGALSRWAAQLCSGSQAEAVLQADGSQGEHGDKGGRDADIVHRLAESVAELPTVLHRPQAGQRHHKHTDEEVAHGQVDEQRQQGSLGLAAHSAGRADQCGIRQGSHCTDQRVDGQHCPVKSA